MVQKGAKKERRMSFKLTADAIAILEAYAQQQGLSLTGSVEVAIRLLPIKEVKS